jgi:hypothetical protein
VSRKEARGERHVVKVGARGKVKTTVDAIKQRQDDKRIISRQHANHQMTQLSACV